jgi:hypothetical protein
MQIGWRIYRTPRLARGFLLRKPHRIGQLQHIVAPDTGAVKNASLYCYGGPQNKDVTSRVSVSSIRLIEEMGS